MSVESPKRGNEQGERRAPLVIAHRGASGDEPENTLVAFERAIEQTADMIETDLHLTRDGVVVIHHDAHLERLGGEGEIRDQTSAQLAELDAAPGASVKAQIPTLLDVLDSLGHRIEFNLELKVGAEAPYDGIEALVLAEVEARGFLPRMLFSSFDDGVLERLRRQSASARLAVLVSPTAPSGILDRAERVGAEAINPQCSLVHAAGVAEAHAAGLAVYPYTANATEEMNRLLDCGVDGLITNFPSRLRSLLGQR